jgi:hypothetical protein
VAEVKARNDEPVLAYYSPQNQIPATGFFAKLQCMATEADKAPVAGRSKANFGAELWVLYSALYRYFTAT